MGILSQSFTDRLQEIEEYLVFLSAVEDEMKSGTPKIGLQTITVTQQKILLSSVYLQLYNLVEATISKCVDTVCTAVTQAKCHPADLTIELRKEWVRYRAKTHCELNCENRLNQSLELCKHLIEALPVDDFQINIGGGGNWNDEEIYDLSKRLGCDLNVSAEINKKVKQPMFDGEGAMVKIMKLRNKLAHGNISFGECGENITVNDLRDLKDRTSEYLAVVVFSFESYVDSYKFLKLDSRPNEMIS